jgi:hypothetical protein
MTTTTNSNKNAQKPIISQNVAEEITSVFVRLQQLLSATPEWLQGVDAQTTEGDKMRAVGGRAILAVAVRQEWLKEQEVAAFRDGVRAAILPHLDAARKAKEEYDAALASMSAAVRAMVKPAPFPTYIHIPVSDMSEVFAEGTPVEEQVLKLKKMGYTIAKPANGAYSIRFDLPKSILGDTSAK